MISVLMTTYNCAAYISQAIKSIIDQTYKNFEFIIVDDGSKDNTEKIVSSFIDSRISYKKIEHVGRSKALNIGLESTSNEWVALMDADDIAHPLRFEQQLEKYDFKYNSIACSWCIYFKKGRIKYFVQTPTDASALRNRMALHSYICNPSVIFNKNFILTNGGYSEDLKNSEDYELWLRLLNKSNFIVVKEYLMFMRDRDISLSRYDLELTKNEISHIQNKYSDLEKHFGITNHIEQNQKIGWRYYFYGDKKNARKTWMKHGTKYLLYPQILTALIVTCLGYKLFNWFVEKRIRLRISLSIKKIFSHKIRDAQKILSKRLQFNKKFNE